MPFGTFLNGRPATQLRGLNWLTLSDAAQVGTRGYVSDGGGGGTLSWSYGGTVACRVDPLGRTGSPEALVADRLSDRSTHQILMPPGTALDTDQRVRVVNGGTFEITAVDDRTAEWIALAEAVEV